MACSTIISAPSRTCSIRPASRCWCSTSRYSELEEEKAIETLLGYHPEAMIVAGVDQTERSRQLLKNSGVPVVQTMDVTDDADRPQYRARPRARPAPPRCASSTTRATADRPSDGARRSARPPPPRRLPARDGRARPVDRGPRRRLAAPSDSRDGRRAVRRDAGAVRPTSPRSSPATTTWRLERCSSASAAASACPTMSRSSASTISISASPPCRR